MKGNKLISDNGLVEKKDPANIIIIVVCAVISLILIYLGIMAYIVG